MAREGSSGREERTIRLVAALAILVALTTLPGCFITPKPPTPTLTGPDTGWTRTRTVFTTSDANRPGGFDAEVVFNWGDTAAEQWCGDDVRFIHIYAEPGTYVARCRVLYLPNMESFEFGKARGGNWSNPCTVHVVPETLMHPDSICATVQLNHTPTWSCVLPNGSAVYVTTGDNSSVYVLDPGTNSVTKSVRVQSDPTCCVASAAGDRVYVGNHGSKSISVIRTSDDSVLDTIRLSSAPDGMALLPGDTLLCVSHKTENEVSIIRLSNGSAVARIAVSDSPCAMTCTPDGQHVYVACLRYNRLAVISTLDHTVEKTFHTGDRPTSMLFSPSGETVYVACENAQQVQLYRCSDLTRIDSISVDARYLLMLPGNRCLYDVSEYGMSYSTVSVLRRSDNFVLRQFQLSTAGGPSVLPDGSRLYVPNGNVVTVLGPGPK